MGFRRAISCEPLSPPERRREPTGGRLSSERVAPSPLAGRSKIFTIASVPWYTDAMDIVTRKERRHFLPPPEGRRVPVPQFVWQSKKYMPWVSTWEEPKPWQQLLISRRAK